MAEVDPILINELDEKTAPANTDYLVIGGADAKKITVENLWKFMYLAMHPVGSIIMSTSNVNPGTIYGGTWAQWGSGRVPVSVNAGDPPFKEADLTGGTKEHSHRVRVGFGEYYGTVGPMYGITWPNTYNKSVYVSAPADEVNAALTGSSKKLGTMSRMYAESTSRAESSFPPYVTCYMWKRTA